MSIRLIASDLDGTLLAPNHRLSARTITAINQATEAGIEVVAATGRGFRSARDILRPCAIETIICSNGALVYDLPADRILDIRPVQGDELRNVRRALLGELPELSFGWETAASVSFEPEFHTDHRFGDPIEEPLESVTEAIKIFVRHPEVFEVELQHLLAPMLPAGMNVSTSGAPFVEITAAGVDKATAVAALANERGIEREHVMTFGDQMNDLAMLQWAGVGVAMGNARDEAKAAADRVTAPNAEDGVAQIIEALIQGSNG